MASEVKSTNFASELVTMTYDDALPEILYNEGGYSNDPQDPGGATNKGITQSTYDSYRKAHTLEQRSVLYIQDQEVAGIYRANYWHDGRCDLLPAGVNLVHFDFCVNSGITQACKTLQGVVGQTRDGIIGPKTLAAISAYGNRRLVTDYTQARRSFYSGLAASRPALSKFLKSWISRTDRIERKALSGSDGGADVSGAGKVPL
jgi:lysozyme family protein